MILSAPRECAVYTATVEVHLQPSLLWVRVAGPDDGVGDGAWVIFSKHASMVIVVCVRTRY